MQPRVKGENRNPRAGVQGCCEYYTTLPRTCQAQNYTFLQRLSHGGPRFLPRAPPDHPPAGLELCVAKKPGTNGDGGNGVGRGGRPPRLNCCANRKGRKPFGLRPFRKDNPATTYFPAELRSIIGAEGLTAVFGMGTGVAPLLWSPERSSKMDSVRRRGQGLAVAGERRNCRGQAYWRISTG